MDVFDSSVWLWGLLTDVAEPNRLLTEVTDGSRSVAVSAYIHDEVTTVLGQASNASELQMTFNNTVADLNNVVFPDQSAVAQTDATEVRNRPSMRVVGTILNIQTKDAPVVVFAADRDEETTLYVADEGFRFAPADHNLTTVKLEPVSVDM
jgi:hypothetical protein